jgi:TRAP-type C4-dicarboxylate transport system permease small subunit
MKQDHPPKDWRWVLNNLEEVVCVGLMGFMALLGFANVITRYLGYSLAYTEELLVAMMVWITLLGAAVGFKRGAHLGLTFIRERLPVNAQRALEWLSLLLTVGTMILVIYLCLAYHIMDEISMDTRSQALDIPQFWYTLAIPVGGLFVIIRSVQASLPRLRLPLGGDT